MAEPYEDKYEKSIKNECNYFIFDNIIVLNPYEDYLDYKFEHSNIEETIINPELYYGTRNLVIFIEVLKKE